MNLKNQHIVIAVDGHSSCGKSTMARQIAEALNIIYIDSGAMYRAVTLFAMESLNSNKVLCNADKIITLLPEINVNFSWEDAQLFTMLNGVNVESRIRQMDVSENVSFVSAIPEVREKLVMLQRKMAETTSVVMDGRDIGTVVFPNANVKLFVTARPEVRAERRFLELKSKGDNPELELVLKNVISRDEKDSTRKTSPLRMADDAILIDNSDLTREEQLEFALKVVKERLA